jgi:hypothetical protein
LRYRPESHVYEYRNIEIAERWDLPPGDVIVTVETVTPAQQVVVDAQFDVLLASPKSLTLLEKLGTKVLSELDAGQTD